MIQSLLMNDDVRIGIFNTLSFLGAFAFLIGLLLSGEGKLHQADRFYIIAGLSFVSIFIFAIYVMNNPSINIMYSNTYETCNF